MKNAQVVHVVTFEENSVLLGVTSDCIPRICPGCLKLRSRGSAAHWPVAVGRPSPDQAGTWGFLLFPAFPSYFGFFCFICIIREDSGKRGTACSFKILSSPCSLKVTVGTRLEPLLGFTQSHQNGGCCSDKNYRLKNTRTSFFPLGIAVCLRTMCSSA